MLEASTDPEGCLNLLIEVDSWARTINMNHEWKETRVFLGREERKKNHVEKCCQWFSKMMYGYTVGRMISVGPRATNSLVFYRQLEIEILMLLHYSAFSWSETMTRPKWNQIAVAFKLGKVIQHLSVVQCAQYVDTNTLYIPFPMSILSNVSFLNPG